MSESPAASAAPPKRPSVRKSRLWSTLKALTRTRVTAGLIVVLPIYVSVVVVQFVFELMRDSSQWVVYGVLEGKWVAWLPASWGIAWEGFPRKELQGSRIEGGIAIFSVFLTIFILYVIGLMTANIVGHRVLTFFERVVDRVPLVKTAYRLPKQILATFTMQSEDGSTPQRVALIPFPSKEVRSIGFITGMSRDLATGEELCTAFIATTPNPTSGFVFVLKRADVVELDWSVEDAVKVVMSGGILTPPNIHFHQSASPIVPPPAPLPRTARV